MCQGKRKQKLEWGGGRERHEGGREEITKRNLLKIN